MHIGTLEPFDVSTKQWSVYIRRIKQYILVNEVREELTVPLLITAVGNTMYLLMCDICSPTYPEDMTFDQLVKLVTKHMEPTGYEKEEVDLAHTLEAAGKHAEVSDVIAAPVSTSGGGGGGGVVEELHHESERRGWRGGGRGLGTGSVEAAVRRDTLCIDPAHLCECGREYRTGAGGLKAVARRESSSGGGSGMRAVSIRRGRRDGGRGPGIGGVKAAVRSDTPCVDPAHICGCGREYLAEAGSVEAVARRDSSSGGGGGTGMRSASVRRGRRDGGREPGAGGVEAAARCDSSCDDPAQSCQCGRAYRYGASGIEATIRDESSCGDEMECISMECGRARHTGTGGEEVAAWYDSSSGDETECMSMECGRARHTGTGGEEVAAWYDSSSGDETECMSMECGRARNVGKGGEEPVARYDSQDGTIVCSCVLIALMSILGGGEKAVFRSLYGGLVQWYRAPSIAQETILINGEFSEDMYRLKERWRKGNEWRLSSLRQSNGRSAWWLLHRLHLMLHKGFHSTRPPDHCTNELSSESGQSF